MPEPLPAPDVAELFTYAAEQIQQAAADLWPETPIRLGEHVPSVTSYVHRVHVGEHILFAKTSLLGVSLVSLLRGACGTWDNILRAQREYATRDDGLLHREAAQLKLLSSLGQPRVCVVAGLHRGVMFTELVAGQSLTELLLAQPGDTADLLTLPFNELRALYRPQTARQLTPAHAITERSIAGTFLRKFYGVTGAVYIDRLGRRCSHADRRHVVAALHRSVDRLHALFPVSPDDHSALAYGDLKPEHVLFPGNGQRPVFLDPGLLPASPTVDVAKLLSRTTLFLAARRPGTDTSKQVMAGIGSFAEGRVLRLSQEARRLWLREVLTLWLMDTCNIVTTYLSAPTALPLPPNGQVLAERASALCTMVDAISADLLTARNTRMVWDRAMANVQQVAV